MAIVAGENAASGVPTLDPASVRDIIATFNRLNPYDPSVVPDLIKLEYPKIADLRCFAVSSKRYVLYTRDRKNRLRIVKASESGLGAILGRTEGESVRKLTRRIWTWILIDELGITYRGSRRRRMCALLSFDVPLRHKLPITQPVVYGRRGFKAFNRVKSYDFRVKPFGFLQAVTPATQTGEPIRPIAPFERDQRKSRLLSWTDFASGLPVRLDWDGNAHAGSIPVMRLSEYVEAYRSHPESKAAALDGLPADSGTGGVLGRLRLRGGGLVRIGKEVDRLDEEDGFDLQGREAPTFDQSTQDELGRALQRLQGTSAAEIAPQLGISERRLRDVLKGRARPRRDLRAKLIRIARTLDDT